MVLLHAKQPHLSTGLHPGFGATESSDEASPRALLGW